MSDLNLPPDEQADHSGPVADPDSFGGDQYEGGGFEPTSDVDDEAVPDPGGIYPPD